MLFAFILWKAATISMSIRNVAEGEWRHEHEQKRIRAERYESIGTKLGVYCVTAFVLSVVIGAIAQATCDSSLAAIEGMRIIGSCESSSWCQEALIDHLYYSSLSSTIAMVCKIIAIVAFML